MKGYLERLAASASRPQSRLRPVIGSIFAEGRREEMEEVSLPLVTERASEPSPAQPAPHAERSRPTPEPTSLNTGDHPRKPQSIREDPATFSPLLPPKIHAVDPVALHISEPATRTVGQPHLQSQVVTPIEHPEHSLEMPTQQGRQVLAPPLLLQSAIEKKDDERNSESDSQATGIRIPVEPAIGPISKFARADSREMMPAPGAPERSQTEEILIHIGRIEVIAVPPPGVRSSALPTNRFTSLDDYLKRRDGRAR